MNPTPTPDTATTNQPPEKCPKCGAAEIASNTPRTTYTCGASDYDQRPGTFKPCGDTPPVDIARLRELLAKATSGPWGIEQLRIENQTLKFSSDGWMEKADELQAELEQEKQRSQKMFDAGKETMRAQRDKAQADAAAMRDCLLKVKDYFDLRNLGETAKCLVEKTVLPAISSTAGAEILAERDALRRQNENLAQTVARRGEIYDHAKQGAKIDDLTQRCNDLLALVEEIADGDCYCDHERKRKCTRCHAFDLFTKVKGEMGR